MPKYELKLPAMGESVAEATITSWMKEIGDTIELDDVIVEVATDKVDSEVPSEVEGKLVEILAQKDDVVKVGQTIAIIEVEGEETLEAEIPSLQTISQEVPEEAEEIEETIQFAFDSKEALEFSSSDKFFSPLVKSIAKKEGVTLQELNALKGTGKGGRVTKDDMLNYVNNRAYTPVQNNQQVVAQTAPELSATTTVSDSIAPEQVSSVISTSLTTATSEDEIIEMSRMGKLISKHMTDSLRISAHVQSFIEIDVTNIVKWRQKVRGAYYKREGEKITFTPIFMQAIAQTIKKHPMVNISVNGDKIIKKGNINLGMAAALPDGNLIVPVIKNADQLSLIGMTKTVNDLAKRARANQLKPDEIQGGTYTVTNVGSFGSITGTPIINQPQVAILALGAIVKKPSVIETPDGDFIGIRHKMIVSHSYDHRVVNGAEGGMFIKTLKDILESWNINQDF